MTSTSETALHAPIRRVLRSFGLPSLASFELTEDRLVTRHFRAVLVDGQRVEVVIPRAGLPRRPNAHLRAAQRLLRRNKEPSPILFRSVWSDELQATIVLRSQPAGTRAIPLLERQQLDVIELYSAIGRYLARRPAIHQPAGWADASGFQSMPSFHDVMVRSAATTECVLRVSGLDPGPAADEVFARFSHALEHAHFPAACALTHGGLGAPNVRFEKGELVEIEGWAQALLADPLYEWGALHHMGEDAVDIAAAAADGLIRDPHRLAVGFFGKLVLDLGTYAALSISSPEPQRSELTAFARHALERSLEIAPPRWGCSRVPVSPPPIWHRLADAVRSVPPPDARDAAFLAGAVAALDVDEWSPEERSSLANRYLSALRPRLLAPSEHDFQIEGGNPLVNRIQSAVHEAFNGQPPFGFHGAASSWSASLHTGEARNAFESLREALVLKWAGVPIDGADLDPWWDIVSWRSDEPLSPTEALKLAGKSSDPLDLCRVLGALSIDGGPDQGELLAVLFSLS